MAALGITFDSLYDTIVEVIDRPSGRVLAHQRFDQYLIGQIDNRTVYRTTDTPEGNIVVLVYPLQLTAQETVHR